MLLPKYLRNNQSGQVLVIFLLVLVIGLALVLSIASRTVTDIRQSTTSDESNRAYFAAESGVEDALKKLKSGSIGTPYDLDFTAVNRTDAKVAVSDITWSTSDPEPLHFGTFKKDDVAQINLLTDFNVLASGSNITATDTLNLFWGDGTKTYSGATVPAIEVSIITYNGSSWGIRKMTFDPSGRSNFCPNVSTLSGQRYKYTVALQLSSNSGCSSNETVSAPPVIARVRFLYNATDIAFGVSANKNLTKQGDKIISTGFTDSGVTRRLEVNRFYPALPAIFDYVLYNGSSNDLCKGSSCP